MDIKKRLKMIRIVEKIQQNKSYAQKIGVQDDSRFLPCKKKYFLRMKSRFEL